MMQERAKQIVADYFNQHVDVTDGTQITTDDVFIVWFCKTLQNWKALLSTTVPFDAIPSAQSEHMHTVMLKIAEKYEKAMNTSCILNPMAWALHQTWKEYDR